MDRGTDPARASLPAVLMAAGVLLADQVTKILASAGLGTDPVPLLGSFLRLVLRHNRGAAFSLSWGGPLVLTVVTALAVVVVAFLLLRRGAQTMPTRLALGAILGGACGNLLDRLLRGAVIDFIDIGTSSWRWPTFNVADIAITLGGITLAVVGLLGREPSLFGRNGKADVE